MFEKRSPPPARIIDTVRMAFSLTVEPFHFLLIPGGDMDFSWMPPRLFFVQGSYISIYDHDRIVDSQPSVFSVRIIQVIRVRYALIGHEAGGSVAESIRM